MIYAAAYRYAKDRHEMLVEAQDSLRKAQKCMKKYVDQHRRAVEFNVGDKVLLKLTPQIKKQIVNKKRHSGLIPRYDRSFERRKGKAKEDALKEKSKDPCVGGQQGARVVARKPWMQWARTGAWHLMGMEVGLLQRVLCRTLHEVDVQAIFRQVVIIFHSQISEAFSRLDISSQQARQRAYRDVQHLLGCIRSLPSDSKSNPPNWGQLDEFLEQNFDAEASQ
ncbi:hypothetical protein MTR67_007588 [Solanum verrucosum]|uniref:Uncharacterized protein n=1 Tax=Solanum verrucosum TaxID=315347 RepID=A0AAF0Q061_SOLVR|nr:hypothetical protein MTR67_007588 [Solanum verrucosum]